MEITFVALEQQTASVVATFWIAEQLVSFQV